jgi:transposase
LALHDQLVMVRQQILEADRRILAWHRASEVSRRLAEIPGVGPLIATAPVAAVPDPYAFRSGRDFSAWIGLVPREAPPAASIAPDTSPRRETAICEGFS